MEKCVFLVFDVMDILNFLYNGFWFVVFLYGIYDFYYRIKFLFSLLNYKEKGNELIICILILIFERM